MCYIFGNKCRRGSPVEIVLVVTGLYKPSRNIVFHLLNIMMNAQFFKKIGFKGARPTPTETKGSKSHAVKASSRIKRNNKLGKAITYKDAVVLLRKKLKKYKFKFEQETAVNKELARRLAEYKAKYEEEKKALELMTADCATWRKFAMTLQVHPNNHANRRHNLGENVEDTQDGNGSPSNQSNTPSNMYISGRRATPSQRQIEIDEEIQELESTFHTIWDTPSSESLNRSNDLFDSFFICGAPVLEAFEAFDAAPGSKHVLSKCRASIAPKILYGFGAKNELSLPTSIESFCFPSGVKPKIVKVTSSASNLSHVLFGSSTDENRLVNSHAFKLLGTVDSNPEAPLYGYCIKVDRVLEKPAIRTTGPSCVQAPVCYCFLSKHPFQPLFMDVLKHIVAFDKLVNADHWSSVRSGAHKEMSKEHTHGHGRPSKNTVRLLQKMFVAPLPSLEQTYAHDVAVSADTALTLKYDRTSFVERKQLLQTEDDHCIARWAGPVLLSSLSVDRFVVLLGYALLEQKIIFQSSSEYTASSCVMAFEALLRPFRWTGPVIPVLPKSALQCVEAPVPILAGVTSATRKYLNNRDDVIVVRVDEGSLVLPTENDEMHSSFHLYRVPDCDRLCHKLQQTLEYIYAGPDDKGQFDIDVSRGEVRPSPVRVEAMQNFSNVLHAYLLSLVAQSKTNKEDHNDNPTSVFLNKFKKTQIMSHFAQTHSAGSLIDDEDDFESSQAKDTDTLVSNVNTAPKGSTLLNDDDDDSIDGEEGLLQICNDEQEFGK